jgi:hypothetical protein
VGTGVGAGVVSTGVGIGVGVGVGGLVGAVIDGFVGSAVADTGVSCPGNGAIVGTGVGTIAGVGRTPFFQSFHRRHLPFCQSQLHSSSNHWVGWELKWVNFSCFGAASYLCAIWMAKWIPF